MKSDDHHFGPWQFLILGLSFLVLGALLVECSFQLSEPTLQVLHGADTLVCMVFLSDFGYRFNQAENKWRFMRWGWIDLISSIPVFGLLRWGRMVRVVRIIRVLRGIRSAKVVMQYIFAHRIKGTVVSAALLSLVLVTASAVLILQLEDTPDSKIKTGGDALWWAIATITTVGYGDLYPMTVGGRVIGAILMTAGVGVFAIVSGFFAALFLKPDEKKQGVTLEHIKAELEEIKRRLDEKP